MLVSASLPNAETQPKKQLTNFWYNNKLIKTLFTKLFPATYMLTDKHCTTSYKSCFRYLTFPIPNKSKFSTKITKLPVKNRIFC